MYHNHHHHYNWTATGEKQEHNKRENRNEIASNGNEKENSRKQWNRKRKFRVERCGWGCSKTNWRLYFSFSRLSVFSIFLSPRVFFFCSDDDLLRLLDFLLQKNFSLFLITNKHSSQAERNENGKINTIQWQTNENNLCITQTDIRLIFWENHKNKMVFPNLIIYSRLGRMLWKT